MSFSDANREGAIAALRESRAKKPFGVDPTTCDHDYTDDELEFLLAIEDYKSRTGRTFPTWTETLNVLLSLGYIKCQAEPIPPPVAPERVRREVLLAGQRERRERIKRQIPPLLEKGTTYRKMCQLLGCSETTLLKLRREIENES